MKVISVESYDDEHYQIIIPKSELKRIPDFDGEKVYTYFTEHGLALTGSDLESNEDLLLISQIISANIESLKELRDK